MESTTSGTPTPDASDHPIYRIGHLHGNRWVTLRPDEQHSPREHDPDGQWANGVVYRCEDCEETVVVATA